MQRLTYAFRFITACFSQAVRHKQLRTPWFYLWMGAVSLLVLWAIPLVVVIALIGLTPLGMILIGLISILLLFCLLVWGEIAALEICQGFYALNQLEEQEPNPAEQRSEFTHWQEIFLWTLSLPGLGVIRFFEGVFNHEKGEQLDWLGAAYLILPVISLENLRLAEAVERVKQIFRDRLLRFHPDLVGIRLVGGLIQWLLILAGGGLGFWIGNVIADPNTAGVLSFMLGMAIGTLIAGVLATVGISFSSFTRACYYTTLYQWVLNVETTRMSADGSQGTPPIIMSQVMGRIKPGKKE